MEGRGRGILEGNSCVSGWLFCLAKKRCVLSSPPPPLPSLSVFSGHTENITEFFTNTTIDAESVTFAFYQGLWAYNGW